MAGFAAESFPTPKVDKERYSTPTLGGKSRVGGMLWVDDVTNILNLHWFNCWLIEVADLATWEWSNYAFG